RVLRELVPKALSNQHFNIKIRLAGHVLFPFLLDGQGSEAMEIIERKLASVFNKVGGEFVAGGEVGHGEKKFRSSRSSRSSIGGEPLWHVAQEPSEFFRKAKSGRS